ncbi:hypothetical protein ACLA_046040 [Paecilomyces variotii No. 5]|uniref:Uncharacterized protein n=1 Tax=Byssochlamys spectabilis (strain No. 5 / NBRC 109023) TaxID=1356009 RepID=V5GC59_BYSSN|nr:hypothetical protein ACLA_046040 [Paecilomyces variotii No. 5]
MYPQIQFFIMPSLDIYLTAPASMLLSLIAGVVMTLVHHFFYQRLEGKDVPNADFKVLDIPYTISDQQINISAGTVFAFLAKVLLGLAATTASQQLFWKAIKSRTTKVAVIDDLSSVAENVFILLRWSLWRRYPLLMLLGLIGWLLPVASVITPATLSVHPELSSTSELMRVPQVNFTNLDFSHVEWSTQGPINYLSSQDSIRRVAQVAASEGEILPIPSPNANSSWFVNFHGPSLSCNPVDGSLQNDIVENMLQTTKGQMGFTYAYMAWTPTRNSSVPFYKNSSDSYMLKANPLETDSSFGNPLTAPLSLFVGTFPTIATQKPSCNFALPGNQCSTAPCNDTSCLLEKSTILQCDLYNTSYTTNFTFVNGVQNVNISLGGVLNYIPYLDEPWNNWTGPTVATSPNMFPSLQRFAYQSVMESFTRLLVGSIGYGFTSTADSLSGVYQTAPNTSILSTALSETPELLFLNDGESTSVLNDQSLADAIEHMFQNITVSLMSLSQLRPDYSSPYAPSDTNVTITTTRNAYAYSRAILWITYGIAIFLTLVSILLGIVANRANQGSYSSNFSTIMRTTRNASLSSQIRLADCSGKDPLPKYISDTTISFLNPGKFNIEAAEELRKESRESEDRQDASSQLLHENSSAAAEDLPRESRRSRASSQVSRADHAAPSDETHESGRERSIRLSHEDNERN